MLLDSYIFSKEVIKQQVDYIHGYSEIVIYLLKLNIGYVDGGDT